MDIRHTVARSILLLGLMLTILGGGTYVLTTNGATGSSFLLPAFFGIFFLVAGILAHKQLQWHRSLLYMSMCVATLAILFTIGDAVVAIQLFSENTVEQPTGVLEQAITTLMCGWFIAISIKRMPRLQKSA